MPQLTVCPSCAERLDPEDKFCGNCGTDLAAPSSAGPAASAERRRPWQPPVDATAPAVPAPPAPRAPEPPAPQAPEPGTDTSASDEDAAPTAVEHLPEPADYGLAPPVPAPAAGGPAAPGGDARPAPTPRPGVADPREELLAGATAVPCAVCGATGSDADGNCRGCGRARPRGRDHVERETAGTAAVTDRGLRHHRNEDAFALSGTRLPDGTPATIAVVCDGVSSASRPDEASAAAASAADERLAERLAAGTEPRTAMREALLTAAEAVNSLAAQGGQDTDTPPDPYANAPACTCVSAVVTGGLLTVGWVGDSRAYWVPDDRAAQRPARLTEDDSWAARMVEAGLMSQEEAYSDARAHAITGWLGADAEEVDPHTACFEPDAPGVVVVCTDGLWNYAESAEQLAAVVPADARLRPLACARALVRVALAGGGHDNVTVAVLPFPGPGTAPRGGRADADEG
ncbi:MULTISPECIES: PP2C family serine/threonine-protein phosphatase [Streptomycetaceae]|uniref:Magnesium or manganese-dependent protein phosphatase n=1 Tax=Streptantibioticus cattleyicolor (strain ATCC 35852 / DSM 46488 / JCM 4925 / NBRC 14057 / NRRL 8057) TaxID=1003195 RepID=F8JS33_STREN|nr:MULTISPECIES: protein phosphatase 2C domain-containing protein [Streptomycetaceae]AEW94144.1 magnesium or manganese-dependent protein phosphatase [Streptantibioticus cattleyicolor NRRL 8057 = DSM 46488]MYS58809.1 zinc-ribbon domain-containing protein [Streptomyces sp. SID5468]CCB74497.1 putative magnesium or manganese-dependent protein phosphatase [Streptantibioticus cattleyicolor NRRL 8057 = DSM 46488]